MNVKRYSQSGSRGLKRRKKSSLSLWIVFAICLTGLFLVNYGIAAGDAALPTLFATFTLGLVLCKLGGE